MGNYLFSPGDVIRNRKDNIDYVIQTITAVAFGAAFLVTATTLLTNDLKQFYFPYESALNDEFIKVIPNTQKLLPNEVSQVLKQRVDEALGHDLTLIEALDKPENQVLKDLILLGATGSEHSLQQGILDIAETIVREGGGTPTKTAIRTWLTNLAPNSENEFIEDLTTRVQAACVTASRRVSTNVDSSVANLIELTQGADIVNSDLSAFRVIRKFGYASFNKENDKRVSQLEEDIAKVLFGNINTNRDYFGGHPFLKQFLKDKTKEERVRHLGEELIKKYTGRLTPRAKQFIEKEIRPTLSAFKKGRLTYLAQAIINDLDIGNSREWLSNRIGINKALGDSDWKGHYSYLSKQRGKGLVLGRLQDFSAIRKSLDFERFLKNLPDVENGLDGIITIDTQTFLNEILQGSKVVVGDSRRHKKITDKELFIKLRESLGKEESILLRPQQLRELIERKAAGKPLFLNKILQQSQSISTRLSRNARSWVNQFHGEQSSQGYRRNGGRIGFFQESGLLAMRDRRTEKLLQQDIPIAEKVRRALKLKTNDARTFLITDNAGDTYASKDIERLAAMAENLDIDLKKGLEQNNNDIFENSLVIQRVESGLDNVGKEVVKLPFTQLATIEKQMVPLVDEKVRQRFALKKNLRRLKDLMEVIPIKPHFTKNNAISKVFWKALPKDPTLRYNFGRAKIKAAIATIQKPEGGGWTRIVGSDVDVPLEEQLKRIDKFLGGKSGILDIETKELEGRKIIKEIALKGHVDVDTAAKKMFVKTGINSEEQEIDSIIQLAEQTKTLKVIGTHSAYDFNVLLQEGRRMLNNPKLTPQKKKELFNAVRILEKAAKEKLFDLQLFHQIAGSELGSTSLGYLIAEFLGRVQEHKAESDVNDSFKLLYTRWNSFKENQEKLTIHYGSLDESPSIFSSTETIIDKNLIWYDNNPFSPYSGRFRRLLDIKESHDETGPKISAIYEEMDAIRNGDKIELHGSGRAFPVTVESPNLLGELNKNSTLVTAENLEEILDTKSLSLADASNRIIRQYLNPTSKTFWSPVDFNPQKQGPFAAFSYVTNQKSIELFENAKSELDSRVAKRAKKLKRDLDWTDTLEMRDLSNQAVAKVTKGIKDENLREAVSYQLEDMLNSPFKRRLLLDVENSALARLHASNVSQHFLQAAESESEGYRHTYTFFISKLMEGLSTQENITTDSTYGMRMSLALGNERASFKFNDGLAGIGKLDTAMQNLAGRAIFQLTKEDENGKTYKLFKSLGYDVEKIKDMAVQYQKDNPDMAKNTQLWKEAVTKLGMDENRKWKLLIDTHHKILKEMSGDVILDSWKKQKEVLIKQNAAQEKIAYMERLISEGEERISKSKTPLRAAKQVIVDHLKSKGERDSKIFQSLFDQSHSQLDIDKIIGSTTLNELLKNAFDQGNEIVQNFTLEGNEHLLKEAIEKAIENENGEFEKGVRGFDLQTFTGKETLRLLMEQTNSADTSEISGKTIREMIHTMATNSAPTANVTGKMERMAQHEFILTNGAMAEGKFEHIGVSMLAIGGAMSLLMAAKEPHDDGFSEGKASNNAWLNPYAKFSEIPGNSVIHTTLQDGDQNPFHLQISYKGFVASKDHHDMLQEQTYNIISNHVEVNNSSLEILDKRRTNHKVAANELLKTI